MGMRTLTDLRRLEDAIELQNMSDLLADFRRHVERKAGTPIEQLDANAALLLHDLCEFLKLGAPQRQKVLGHSAAVFVHAVLLSDDRLSIIH